MYARARHNSDSGFTLVEVSIVLVVIALLIGSVLVAVNILQNARITSAITTLQSIQSAVSTYNQNYGAVPGDDAQAVARFGVTNNGGGNGIIGAATLSGTFNDTSAALTNGNGNAESRLVWSHLRAAGLIRGQGGDVTQPGNPFGGVFGIQNGAFSADGIGLGTNVVCVSNVPGAAAVIIDQREDDGIATTGNMRAGTVITGAASAYVDTSTYVLCTRAL
ncbi:MAG: prepilin-type N-terminal cleavage/methylation domain-containing protein [Alphaproteobacteria bacterium]|nr:prepilin-type N-terminal cleavage/methylation domain-containing protein [Alphaproteobacteria bacterium]